MKLKDQQSIVRAAKAGGKVIQSYFGKTLTITEKSVAADFRTEADIGSEKAILAILERTFPTYNIFSEECGFIDKKSDYTFYIDPLDGTNNFALGIPNFSVSIALVKGTETIFGLVYLPLHDLVYRAVKGEGAFCNNQKLKPSVEVTLDRSTSAFVCGYHCPKPVIIKFLSSMTTKMKRVLVSWSVASDICLLASGKIETLINLNTELHDFLAGKLIAKEAGCVVTDLNGTSEKNDFNGNFLMSSNAVIHRKLLKTIV
ncbi:MAG: inositol monophosphatase [Candidatus Taylorbacteria bacterium]|nr:inositol monophosphatase [Candidatus Taylorbacteria bacterium]